MDKQTMQAAVFEGGGVIRVREIPIPRIETADDVLLRVEAASICGSDLHILKVPQGQRGDPGTTMGHEFAATVAAVGSNVQNVAPGDRVVVEPNIRCGVCPACRSGHENLCRNAQNIGQWKNGGFAEYCVVPAKQLHPIPPELPAKLAALAEPLACVLNGVRRIRPLPFERVVLFGAGAIGLIFLRVLKVCGVRHVAVCETMESRRRDAARCGADAVIDPTKEPLDKALGACWGELADIAIDAVGAGPVLAQAIDGMKCGGRILVFGQDGTQRSSIRPADINIKELTITATLSTLHSFPPAIELLQDPALQLDRLITHELPLDEIETGIALMRAREAVKIVLYPRGADGQRRA